MSEHCECVPDERATLQGLLLTLAENTDARFVLDGLAESEAAALTAAT